MSRHLSWGFEDAQPTPLLGCILSGRGPSQALVNVCRLFDNLTGRAHGALFPFSCTGVSPSAPCFFWKRPAVCKCLSAVLCLGWIGPFISPGPCFYSQSRASSKYWVLRDCFVWPVVVLKVCPPLPNRRAYESGMRDGRIPLHSCFIHLFVLICSFFSPFASSPHIGRRRVYDLDDVD